jgi:hypothetical protein
MLTLATKPRTSEVIGREDVKSTTVRYVGKKTLFQHIDAIKNSSRNKIALMKTIITSHLHILRGITRLQNSGVEIIHFNMEPNSFIYDEVRGVPVIADYSASFLLSDIQSQAGEKGGKYDYGSLRDYIPQPSTLASSIQCLDVVLISHIMHIQIPRDNATSTTDFDAPLSSTQLTELVEITRAFSDASVIAPDQKDAFLTAWGEFIAGLGTVPLYRALDCLIRGWKFWDLYSVSAMYKLELVRLFGEQPSPWLNSYIAILNAVILSSPRASQDGEWRREPLNVYGQIVADATLIDAKDAETLRLA